MTQRYSSDTPDYALPSRFFDQEATQIAQPVVPLTNTGAPAGEKPARRTWLLAAVALSAVVGSIAGVAALSLYQRRGNNTNTRAVTLPAVRDTTSFATPAATPFETMSTQRDDAAMTNPAEEFASEPDESAPVNINSRMTVDDRRADENRNMEIGNGRTSESANAKINANADKQPTRNTTTRNAATNAPNTADNDKREAEREAAEERRAYERLLAERQAEARRKNQAANDNNNARTNERNNAGERNADERNNGERNTGDDAAPRARNRRYADRVGNVLGVTPPRSNEQRPRNEQPSRGEPNPMRDIFEGRQPPR